jgi:hypothetical protein
MTSRKRSSGSNGPEDTARSKKTKVASAKTDSNGDRYWEISKMRRVTISSFRGKTQVNVREYYEKDGQELPGKKVREHGSSEKSYPNNIISGNFIADRSIFCLDIPPA